MTETSINQISSKDLTRINKYIDHIERILKDRTPKSKISKIQSTIREEIFQAIEDQVESQGTFDINEILNRNKQRNKNIFTGKGKDEVIFRIKKPNFLISGKPDKGYNSTENAGTIEGHQSSSNHSYKENRNVSTNSSRNRERENSILLGLNIFSILFIISFTSSWLEQTSYLPFFLIVVGIGSLFILKIPSSSWIRMNYIVIATYFTAFASQGPYWEMDLMIYIIPFFVFSFLYRINSDIDEDLGFFLEAKTVFKMVLKTLILSSIIGILSFLILITWVDLYGIMFQYGNYNRIPPHIPPFFSLMFSVLLIMALFYYFALHERIERWDEQYLVQDNQYNNEFYGGNATNPDNPSNVGSRPKKPTISMFPSKGFVEIDVNVSKSKDKLNFRIFTIPRLILSILLIGTLAGFFIFDFILGYWAIIYQMKLLGYEEPITDYQYSTYLEIVEQLYIAGVLLFSSLLILGIIREIIKWIFNRKTDTVIKYLVIRQGIVRTDVVNTPPENMKPGSYQKILGDLVMDEIITLKHLEAKE